MRVAHGTSGSGHPGATGGRGAHGSERRGRWRGLTLTLTLTLTLPLTRTPTLTPTLTPTPTLTQELEDDVRSVYAAYPEPWRVQVKGGG